MSNASVDAFREYMDQFTNDVDSLMTAAIAVEGKRLAEQINAAAPKGKTGRLEHSATANFGDVAVLEDFHSFNVQHEVQHGSDFTKVVVTAGGPDTTKPEKNGKVKEYDYALATEFGTGHEHARPFFYPTFRREKPGIEQRLAAAFGQSQLLWESGYRPVVTSAEPQA